MNYCPRGAKFVKIDAMKLLVSIVALLILIFSTNIALAVDGSPSATIKVSSIAGSLEKVKEKITLFFKFKKEDKADYYQYLTEKRLAEEQFVIENNQIDLVEETASRYSTYVGTLANYITANKLVDKKESTLKMLEADEKVIGRLQNKFDYFSGWWIAIEHDKNTIKIFSQKLKDLN